MTDLTPAQVQIAALVSEGLLNKQIAARLGVEEATVKAHVGQAIKRLGFSNRVQLAVWYVKRDFNLKPRSGRVLPPAA